MYDIFNVLYDSNQILISSQTKQSPDLTSARATLLPTTPRNVAGHSPFRRRTRSATSLVIARNVARHDPMRRESAFFRLTCDAYRRHTFSDVAGHCFFADQRQIATRPATIRSLTCNTSRADLRHFAGRPATEVKNKGGGRRSGPVFKQVLR